MNLLRLAFSCLLLFFCLFAQSQHKPVDSLSVFDPLDYPDSSCQVFHNEYRFGPYYIALTNLRPKSNYGCRGFILVTKGFDTIYHTCFPEIMSNGGASGVFSSDSNRFRDYFFISKYGDYNGRLIILSKTGKIQNINGSYFYLSKDHTFVFANQDSDIGGLTVWDLSKSKLLYDSETKFTKGDFTVGERFLWRICYDKHYHYLIYLKDLDEKDDARLFTLKFDNRNRLISQENIDRAYLISLPELPVNNIGSSCSCDKPGLD